LHNLALERKYSKRLKQFRTATLTELRRTKAPMTGNLPPVGTEKQIR